MDSPKLTVSVIVVTYNRADMLVDTLESLTRQSRLPDEVLVVDNNSTDTTRQVAESFMGRLNLRYIFEKIQGTSTARNTGVENATGDILAFLDDDCVADKEWLYYLEAPFLKDPAIGIVGGEVLACRVKGTLVEDFCIADAMLKMGEKSPEKNS